MPLHQLLTFIQSGQGGCADWMRNYDEFGDKGVLGDAFVGARVPEVDILDDETVDGAPS